MSPALALVIAILSKLCDDATAKDSGAIIYDSDSIECGDSARDKP